MALARERAEAVNDALGSNQLVSRDDNPTRAEPVHSQALTNNAVADALPAKRRALEELPDHMPGWRFGQTERVSRVRLAHRLAPEVIAIGSKPQKHRTRTLEVLKLSKSRMFLVD